jgi:phospholipase C
MPPDDCVEHVVVLMLENRSFDHMLGFETGSLTGLRGNWRDPADPASGVVTVNTNATDEGIHDPGHEFEEVEAQIDAPSPVPPGNPAMGGFVANFREKLVRDGQPAAHQDEIMACFGPGGLRVLGGLARHFTVCTQWYSSIPGPTWPNRFFVQGAQSAGELDNRPVIMPNIFEQLADRGISSRIYFHDIPQALANLRLLFRHRRGDPHFRVARFEEFGRDIAAGKLPAYSFIEPQYFEVRDFRKWWQRLLYKFLGFSGTKASDQHPPHDIRMGERLIKEVYDLLRTSRHEYWRKTMFVVVYDEHGGFYDSAEPPAAVPPVPGQVSSEGFNFDRLGVRVPAVVVSPYVEAGIRDSTPYDHSSVCKTLERLFGLPPLTERDRAASPIGGVCGSRTPRPWPAIDNPGGEFRAREVVIPPSDLQRQLHRLAQELAAAEEGAVPPRAGTAMMAESMEGRVAEKVTVEREPLPSPETEAEARQQVQAVMGRVLG